MNKKGFTLIELLSVIVILAVITLITIPLVSNVINESKKGSVKSSAYGIMESANLYYATKIKDGISGPLEFVCADSKCETSSGDKLSFKGTISSGTVVLLTDGTVEVCITNGDYSATNYVNSTVTDVVTLTEGTCNGINIVSSTETLIKDYEKQLFDQKTSYESQLLTQKNNYEKQISDQKTGYESQLLTQKTSYETQIAQLTANALDTSDGTATNLEILTGKIAYVNKQKITGTAKIFIASGYMTTGSGTTYVTVPVVNSTTSITSSSGIITFKKAGNIKFCATSKAHSSNPYHSYARLYKNGVLIYQANENEIERCDAVTVAVNDTMYYQIASGNTYGVGSFWLYYE